MSDHVIVVDWGTTNFRAFLVEVHSGQVVDEKSSSQGMRTLKSHEFAHYCEHALNDWRNQAGQPSVYLAGMVGARQGWAESPQPNIPVTLKGLAVKVIAAPGFDNGWIVPGAKVIADDGLCDVMRGEEVQVLGIEALVNQASYVCCLPGTHSKWAQVVDGALTRFATAMTGELYQAVLAHTLPGQPAEASAALDEQAFLLGLARVASEGGVLHALFEARSRYLYAGLGSSSIGSFISGVLIGEEVQRMAVSWPAVRQLYLIGSATLVHPYEMALEAQGISVKAISARDATLAGVTAIAANHQQWRGV